MSEQESKTSFTFFTVEEQTRLMEADPKGLASIITWQPNMTSRFTHELMRCDRSADLYAALTTLTHIELQDVYYNFESDAVTSLSAMCIVGEMAESEACTYVRSAVLLFSRVGMRIGLTDELPEEIQQEANVLTYNIKNRIKWKIQRYSAAVN